MSSRAKGAGRGFLASAVGLVLATAVVACGGGNDSEMGNPMARVSSEVVATVQTDPIPNEGDAADDPAIWVDPSDPSRSTIIGTDKKGGLAVYDLSGREIGYVAGGPMTNVDLRQGFLLAGERVALVAASRRSEREVALYRVDPKTRRLVDDVAAREIMLGIHGYGLCMYRSGETGRFFVFVNSEKGEVEQLELFERNGEIDARRVRSFAVGSQTEGCVADDELGRLYIGEEREGIWRYGAEPNAGSSRARVDSTGASGHLEADVEGLTIAYDPNGTGYLIASSQGSDSYAVYSRESSNEYLGSFRIVAGGGIGSVEETDGIDVATASLGPDFQEGLFVAQDGKNGDADQNFKLVPWRSIISSTTRNASS